MENRGKGGRNIYAKGISFRRLDVSPRELRLLIHCLRTASGRGEDAEIRALCSGAIDWKRFFKLVDRHRVVSPVYLRLKRVGGDCVPDAVLADLRDRYRRNAQQVLTKTAELVRIVKQFDKEGIPVLPFKGPVIGLQAYGDVGSRHLGDLDIMVGPEMVSEAHRLLLRAGYRRTQPNFELTPGQASAYFKNNHHFGYMHPNSGLRVELHWRFGSNCRLFPLTFHDIWRDRQTLKLGGVDVVTLSLDHTMLLLCVHGAIHGWFRLFWLDDVARLVTVQDRIGREWNKPATEAGQLGIDRMVAAGIMLAGAILGSPVPDPVRRIAGQDRGVDRLVNIAFRLIAHPKGPNHKPLTAPYLSNKVNRFLLRRDVRYKLMFCADHLRAGYGDWEKIPLPDSMAPLYFVVRPFMWFFRWCTPGIEVHRAEPIGRRRHAIR